MKKQRLKMMSLENYIGVDRYDPIRLYRLPFVGGIYRGRVEKCLNCLSGGERILEVGFGSGVTFLNLSGMYKEIHGLDLTADVEAIMSSFRKLGMHLSLKNGNVLQLPYPDGYFDSVLLISILEHLKPGLLAGAFREIHRVLKPHGEVVYGVPVERKLMNYAFLLLGSNIKEHHFSGQDQVASAAGSVFKGVNVSDICIWPFGKLYEVGRSVKRS